MIIFPTYFISGKKRKMKKRGEERAREKNGNI